MVLCWWWWAKGAPFWVEIVGCKYIITNFSTFLNYGPFIIRLVFLPQGAQGSFLPQFEVLDSIVGPALLAMGLVQEIQTKPFSTMAMGHRWFWEVRFFWWKPKWIGVGIYPPGN